MQYSIDLHMASVRAKTRLNRQDWILAALELLVGDGIAAVTVDRLSRQLKVTRGSFYHHFSDRDELLDALLSHWADSLTFQIREQVARLKLDPATTLMVLLRTIRSEQAAALDAPFRAWALHDERAAAVMRAVDEERLKFIRQQFAALGFEGVDLDNRARLLLFYEIASPATFLDRDGWEERLIERHRLLTSPTRTTDDAV